MCVFLGLFFVSFLFFAEIGRVKKDQIRRFSYGPNPIPGVPMVILDFRSIIPEGKIKGLTFSLKGETHIRDDTPAGHGIKDKIPRICEIEECVGYQLSGYPAGPVVSETFITPVKYATVK